MLSLRSSRSSRPAIQLLQLNAKRRVSSLRSTTPVPLSYDKYPAQTRATSKAPLLIAHGLFGSKQNWRSLGKALSSRLGRDVYALVSLQTMQIYIMYLNSCSLGPSQSRRQPAHRGTYLRSDGRRRA